MTITAIREKLHHDIDIDYDKKVKTIFAIMENNIADSLDLWEDEDLLTK